MRADGGSKAHGPGTCDVNRGSDAHAGGDGAVEAGGEDVREHGQVHDLFQCLIAVRETQQVPVGVGNQHVLGLSAYPAAHVHVAVGAAGAVRVDVEANAGLLLLTVPAAAAGDVEGDRDDVAYLDELDVGPTSTTSPVISWPRTRSFGAVVRPRTMCWSEPQMLVVTVRRIAPWRHLPADVGRVDAWSVFELKRWVVSIDDLNDTGFLVGDCSVS